MSILPETFMYGKRCLIYCGDEACNCDCSPRTPENMERAAVNRKMLADQVFSAAQESDSPRGRLKGYTAELCKLESQYGPSPDLDHLRETLRLWTESLPAGDEGATG